MKFKILMKYKNKNQLWFSFNATELFASQSMQYTNMHSCLSTTLSVTVNV